MLLGMGISKGVLQLPLIPRPARQGPWVEALDDGVELGRIIANEKMGVCLPHICLHGFGALQLPLIPRLAMQDPGLGPTIVSA